MNRLAHIVGLAAVVVGGMGTARAQQAPVTSIVEGAGVKVGEGTVLHPIVGFESGIIQNVFFEEDGANVAGVMRLIGEIAFGSLPQERMQGPVEQAPNTREYGDLALRGEASLAYEEYLSTNDAVQAQRNLTGGLSLQGIANPMRTWQFAFGDSYRRVFRPVNFESPENVTRNINVLHLGLRYRPAGRSILGALTYNNVIDVFESERQRFANRMLHSLVLTGAWQWLPMTRITADASIGYNHGLGDSSTRVSSLPLRVRAGIASSLSVKTTLNGYVGYGRGFYASGPDFHNMIGGLQFGYRYSPQARVAVGYEYDFQDSINANFYRDHAITARLEQQIDRFAILASAELRFRQYRGVISEIMTSETDRNDVIFAVPISARYNFRNWIAATLDYVFTTDQTDFRYIPQPGGPADDPSFTQQVLFGGVRAAY